MQNIFCLILTKINNMCQQNVANSPVSRSMEIYVGIFELPYADRRMDSQVVCNKLIQHISSNI
jgi:hypothetical protein